MTTVLHRPDCEFLRPDGIACTCGAFRRRLGFKPDPNCMLGTCPPDPMGFDCPHYPTFIDYPKETPMDTAEPTPTRCSCTTAPDSYCRIHGPASDDNLERRAQLVHREEYHSGQRSALDGSTPQDHEGHGCSFDPKQRPTPGTVGLGKPPRLPGEPESDWLSEPTPSAGAGGGGRPGPMEFAVTRSNTGAAGIRGAMAQGQAIAEAEQRRAEREFCICNERVAGSDERCPVHGVSSAAADEDKGVPINDPDRPSPDWFCDTAKKLVGGDRRAIYGDAAEDFTRTGKMWAAILGLDEVTPEQVALCMAALKMGRLCNTVNHLDSWVDGIGYLALGGNIAARRSVR